MHYPFTWVSDDIPSASELAIMAADDIDEGYDYEYDEDDDPVIELVLVSADAPMPEGCYDDEPF